MKGIILAAGAGTRLYPATFPMSKILLPVYDRPMLYFPLSTLMLAGIRDILVIASRADLENFRRTLRDGSHLGLRVSYAVQEQPRGIADAFIIGREFIGDDRVALILGDNVFNGPGLESALREASSVPEGAVIFTHWVSDPERFGVAELDGENVVSLEEKPREPKSNYAAVGLYMYGPEVCDVADCLEPSARGELEITDVNKAYLERGELKARVLRDEVEWVDAGTFDSLLAASRYVSEQCQRDGARLMCPELVALDRGYVSAEQMSAWLEGKPSNPYFDRIRDAIRPRL